jgi:tetratricopeptide (TPR) repeat protein
MRALSLLILFAVAPLEPAEQDWTAFEAAVALYRTGQTQAAMEALLRLGPDGLKQSAAAIQRGSTADPRAAAMLHTDSAEAFWRINRTTSLRHLDLARAWAESAAGTLQGFRPRWYLAAGLLLVERGSQDGNLDPAFDHFEAASRAMPHDIAILTATAWLMERMALAPAPRNLARGGQALLSRRMKQQYLIRASTWLEAALIVEPHAAEPALRLGRVKMLQGDREGARALLEPLLERRGVADRIAYLARLFVARLAEQDDRPKAIALYRDAIARVPAASSARMGLARLLLSSNDHSGASEALMPVLRDAAATATADPWAEYLNANLDQARALRRMLRTEVQR